MKNLLFGLIATVLFSFSGNAQNDAKSENEQTESAYMSVKSGDELVKYKFNSVKDFEDNTDKILDEINASANKADVCEITVEISITVNTGIVSTTVTASITASCATVGAAVKKMRAVLIASISG